MSFPPSGSDSATIVNVMTGAYQATASNGVGVEFVNQYLRKIAHTGASLLLADTVASLLLANATTNTLRRWMLKEMQKFSDTLQTTWPDLEDFRNITTVVIAIATAIVN